MILSNASRMFHDPYPSEALGALRADVLPDSTAHMETLAYYFPVVARDSTVLRLHWGMTAVPIRIRAPLDSVPR